MGETKQPADPPEMTFGAVGLGLLLALVSDGVISIKRQNRGRNHA
jgi:hypothetical protein